jgi:ABC-2 type transport system permease protein
MKAVLTQYVAELRRRFWLLKRYALGSVADLLTFYLIFVGIYFSIRSVVGSVFPEEARSLASSQVAGFLAFYFSSMVLSSISNQLRQEADQGTLEQLFIASNSFIWIVIARLAATFTVDLVRAVPLFLLLSITSNGLLHVTPMFFLVFFLLLVGVYGFAILLGGLTLLFKRTGQLPFLFQVLFLGFGFASLTELPSGVNTIVSMLPFAQGVTLLKGIASKEVVNVTVFSYDFIVLLVNTAAYALMGTLFFLFAERLAKQKGLLGRY